MINKIIPAEREKMLSQLDGNINIVKDDMVVILEKFFDIGQTLSYIQKHKLFKLKNYKNFIEFCKSEFGLSKNQSYNLVAIYDRFNTPEFLKFNYSQLTEMLSLSDEQLEKIDEKMSAKKIRSIKKDDIEEKDSKDVIQFGEQVVIDVAPGDIVEHHSLENKMSRKELIETNLKFIDENSSLRMKVKQLESENATLCSKFYDDLKEKDHKIEILNSKNTTLSTINDELKKQIEDLLTEKRTIKKEQPIKKEKKETSKTIKKEEIKDIKQNPKESLS